MGNYFFWVKIPMWAKKGVLSQFTNKGVQMVRWEPEGRYHCAKSMAIAPFWFSLEQHALLALNWWYALKWYVHIYLRHAATYITQCFHFEGNFLNSGKSWSFPGNFREMKKFQEIQEYGKYICKHVLKIWLLWFEKAKTFSSRASRARINLFLFI